MMRPSKESILKICCSKACASLDLDGKLQVSSPAANLYPQEAKVSHDVYMLLPSEKFMCDANGLRHDATAPSPWQQKYRLKLLQNLHGLKDAGATWFDHLAKELTAMNFQQGLPVNPVACVSVLSQAPSYPGSPVRMTRNMSLSHFTKSDRNNRAIGSVLPTGLVASN